MTCEYHTEDEQKTCENFRATGSGANALNFDHISQLRVRSKGRNWLKKEGERERAGLKRNHLC